MRIKLSTKQLQKTILAPHMQQSIELLLLPVAELNTAIEAELQENPLLEIDEERTKDERPDPAKTEIENIINERIRNYESGAPTASYDFYNDEQFEAKQITKSTSLEDYLLQQLQLEITSPLEIKIGEFIIGNINEDGYLPLSCDEIGQLMGITDTEMIQQVLDVIQNFEPLGIASRDLKECLTTQITFTCNGTANILSSLVNNHLDDLARKNYAEIARKTKISLDQIRAYAKTISHLEPKPARSYRPINHNLYIKPDIIISEDDEGHYHVKIVNDDVPHLRINKKYQRILSNPKCTKDEKEFISERVKKALFFIKSIEQRNQTIMGIAEYILKAQKDFFEHGREHLKPMILKDVAQSIDRNESTISRAINHKYVDTPQGLFALKYFFSTGVQSDAHGTSISNKCVKEEIRSYIAEENSGKPFSDQEIYHHLSKKGMKVARRTVSKYRQSLKILPSHLRKI